MVPIILQNFETNLVVGITIRQCLHNYQHIQQKHFNKIIKEIEMRTNFSEFPIHTNKHVLGYRKIISKSCFSLKVFLLTKAFLLSEIVNVH